MIDLFPWNKKRFVTIWLIWISTVILFGTPDVIHGRTGTEGMTLISWIIFVSMSAIIVYLFMLLGVLIPLLLRTLTEEKEIVLEQ